MPKSHLPALLYRLNLNINENAGFISEALVELAI
ncbi:hypothetical protein PALA35_01171 [Pseudomonas aeruginosa]|nr:hypothetical protein PALA35_01171 [Pseudomonas aeruginosa]